METILWRRIDQPGLERCVIESVPNGYRLAGTVLMIVDEEPIEIRYSIITDSGWAARTVGAHVQTPNGDRRLALTGDGAGSWSTGDDPLLELYGAIDVDLAWTPATTTLAIRRLDLDVGDIGETPAVQIAFPAHEIERRTHSFERRAPHRYRYRVGDYQADLTVNERGLVVAYPGRWTAEAEG